MDLTKIVTHPTISIAEKKKIPNVTAIETPAMKMRFASFTMDAAERSVSVNRIVKRPPAEKACDATAKAGFAKRSRATNPAHPAVKNIPNVWMEKDRNSPGVIEGSAWKIKTAWMAGTAGLVNVGGVQVVAKRQRRRRR